MPGLCAQTWDSTGNTQLNGPYYFRELIFTSSAAAVAYGHVTFNSNGTYSTGSDEFHELHLLLEIRTRGISEGVARTLIALLGDEIVHHHGKP